MKKFILAALLCFALVSTASAQVSVSVGGGRFFGQRQFAPRSFSTFHSPFVQRQVFAAPVYSPAFSTFAAPVDPCCVQQTFSTFAAPVYSAPVFTPFHSFSRSFGTTIIVR